MHLRAALMIAFACLAVAAVAWAGDCRSTVSGDLRIRPLTSKIFNNTRSIRVLLPPSYGAAENSKKRYPVLYMLDGQNLFVLRRRGLGPRSAEAGTRFFATVVANYKAAGYDDNNFRYMYEQGAKHTESAWAQRLPDALKFLFGDSKPEPEVPDAGNK